jgi:hypothetical protein
LSRGNIADGIADLSCSAIASAGTIAGINTAGSMEHNSRRVTAMIFSFCSVQIIVLSIQTNSAKKLLDFEAKNL